MKNQFARDALSNAVADASPATVPEQGFLRLWQVIGRKAITEAEAKANARKGKRGRRAREAIQGLIPVSPSTWWSGVRKGKYPKPIRLGEGVTAWRVEDILALIAQAGERAPTTATAAKAVTPKDLEGRIRALTHSSAP